MVRQVEFGMEQALEIVFGEFAKGEEGLVGLGGAGRLARGQEPLAVFGLFEVKVLFIGTAVGSDKTVEIKEIDLMSRGFKRQGLGGQLPRHGIGVDVE